MEGKLLPQRNPFKQQDKISAVRDVMFVAVSFCLFFDVKRGQPLNFRQKVRTALASFSCSSSFDSTVDVLSLVFVKRGLFYATASSYRQ